MKIYKLFLLILCMLFNNLILTSISYSAPSSIGDYEIFTLNRDISDGKVSKYNEEITIGKFINGLNKFKLVDKVSYKINGNELTTQFLDSNPYDKTKITYKLVFTLYDDTRHAILDEIYIKWNQSSNFVENQFGPYSLPPSIINYIGYIKKKSSEVSSNLN